MPLAGIRENDLLEDGTVDSPGMSAAAEGWGSARGLPPGRIGSGAFQGANNCLAKYPLLVMLMVLAKCWLDGMCQLLTRFISVRLAKLGSSVTFEDGLWIIESILIRNFLKNRSIKWGRLAGFRPRFSFYIRTPGRRIVFQEIFGVL